MKNKILIFLLLCIVHSGWAQVTDTVAAHQMVDSLIELNKKLIQNRKFDDALLVIEQTGALTKSTFGKDHWIYAHYLYNHGRTYYYQRKYAEAEKLLTEALNCWEASSGKQNLNYTTSLTLLALVFKNQKEYEKAENCNLMAMDIIEKQAGEASDEYANVNNNLGVLYKTMGLSEKALSCYNKSLEITELIAGKETSEYANTLNNIGMLYKTMGEYTVAEPYFLQAISFYESTQEKEWKRLGQILLNLGNLYTETGEYEKADKILNKSLKTRVAIFGTESVEAADVLLSLGSLYTDMNFFRESEECITNALLTYESKFGKVSPAYASGLNALGMLYRRRGMLDKAEEIYLTSKLIKEQTIGLKHIEYVSALNNLAVVYELLGDLDKSESYGMQALDLRSELLGSEHPDNAISYYNLGVFFGRNRMDFEKAEKYGLKALELYKKSSGGTSVFYANTLANLGYLYAVNNDPETGKKMIVESEKIIEKRAGKNQLDYVSLLNTRGIIERTLGNIDSSKAFLLLGKDICELNGWRQTYQFSQILNNLSTTYWLTKEYTHLEDILVVQGERTLGNMNDYSRYLTLDQLGKFTRQAANHFDRIASFSMLIPDKSDKLDKIIPEYFLASKGFLLQNALAMRRIVRQAPDTLQNAFDYWQGYHARLAEQYAKAPDKRYQVELLEARADSLEKILVRSVAGFSGARQNASWRDVQATLRPGEAAVEFVRYIYYNPKPTDSVLYAALVVRPGDEAPHLVYLFEKEDITPLMQGLMGSSFTRINSAYRFRPGPEYSKNLYDFIWRPLDSLLAGSHTVYCSPAGLLHRLNLGAIAVSESATFLDKHKLVLLGSIRTLALRYQNNRVYSNTAYLAGGIQYSMDSLAISTANDTRTRGFSSDSDFSRLPNDSLTRGGVWRYLPDSGKEVTDIATLLRANKYQINVDTGYAATEEAFRSLPTDEQVPRIIHLSTHGYFAPDPAGRKISRNNFVEEESPFTISTHPMIRSGIILAGANQAWTTGRAVDGMQDGILTAYEISQLNLEQTELVVLSACETGLGDIEGNEGVYGLQRAFKIAGARYLIMSLWKVNDQTTRELMTAFYQAWLDKQKPIPEAFQSAQQYMRQKYPDAPYHWAGFVLVE